MLNCTVLLQGDEGPIGPPGIAGPTVRAPRFTHSGCTNAQTVVFFLQMV